MQLAAALAHEPDLLVLDEPFAGLDPGGVDDMTEVLTERARAGATVVFSSHQLDLVEHICESVAIITAAGSSPRARVSALERGDRARLAVQVAGDPAGDWARGLDPELAEVERVESGRGAAGAGPGADSQRVSTWPARPEPSSTSASSSRRLSEVFRDVRGWRTRDEQAAALLASDGTRR